MSITQDQRQAARNRIETLVRAMFAIKGFGEPDPKFVIPIVDNAEAHLSQRQMLHPDNISVAAIGDIQSIFAAAKMPPPVNAYSADAARVSQGDGAAGSLKRSDLDPLNLSRSSARFRDIDGAGRYSGLSVPAEGGDTALKTSADWGSPAGLAKMREYAIQAGLPWAAGNTELLRLGPAAIGALADVHFKQEAYKRLTTDASFKAKEIVTVARFAKKEHIDANHLAGVMSHGVKTLAGDDIPARRKLDTAFAGYMEHPERPEAKKHLFKTLDPYADDPKKKPEVYKMLEAVKIKREDFDAAHRSEKTSQHTTDIKQDQAAVEQVHAVEKRRNAELETKKAEVKVASFDALPDDPPKAKAETPKANDPAPRAPVPKKVASGPSAANQPKPA